MSRPLSYKARAFRTAWFSKAAKKARITDKQLCAAFHQVLLGQADDLGGGVHKKRLGNNLYRSIILARSGNQWIFEYLFAKKDRANIEDDELLQFRKLAKLYGALAPSQLEQLIHSGQWTEICHESEI